MTKQQVCSIFALAPVVLLCWRVEPSSCAILHAKRHGFQQQQQQREVELPTYRRNTDDETN